MKQSICVELPGYGLCSAMYEDEPGMIALVDTSRKAFRINEAFDHNTARKYIRFEHEDEPNSLTLEEAQMLTATLARQMELSAMCGRFTMLRQEGEDLRTEAKLFAEAIRVVLRHAGLSDAWHC